MILILASIQDFFTSRKKDGTYRAILNLKKLMKNCTKEHYEMESIKNVFKYTKTRHFPSLNRCNADLKIC